MTTQLPSTPDCPEGFDLSQEGFILTDRLDYYGQPYKSWVKPKKDLGKAWSSFRDQFRNQEPRQPGSNSFNPNLGQIEWKELNDKFE